MIAMRNRYLLVGVFIAASFLAGFGPAAETAARKFAAADSSKQRVAIVDEMGAILWEHRIGPLHDLHVLPGGNLPLQLSWTRIVALEPDTAGIEQREYCDWQLPRGR